METTFNPYDLLQALLETVIKVVVPVLALYAVSLLKKQGEEVEAKIGSQNWTLIKEVVKSAVLTAEQLGVKKIISDKKAYALEAAQAALDEYGIVLDAKVLSDLIEGAVMEEFNRFKEFSAPLSPPASAGA